MALGPDQLRAARALLNISQDDLAKGSGVAVTSIRQFELGATAKLQQKTEDALLSFLSERIEFIGARGVALREAEHFVLEGENVIAQMFEDIHACLRGQEGAEALFLCGDAPCQSLPEITEYCTKLREAGFTYRSICHQQEGGAPIRVVPANFSSLALQIVYDSTVAQMVAPGRILLVRSPMFAKGLRQTFELLWAAIPALEAETDDEDAAVCKKSRMAGV